MTVFFSQLINGLSLGSIYALIALGYSMVYGIILLLNFAHGDVIMVGAYMSWFVMNQLGLGPVTAVCATILTCIPFPFSFPQLPPFHPFTSYFFHFLPFTFHKVGESKKQNYTK